MLHLRRSDTFLRTAILAERVLGSGGAGEEGEREMVKDREEAGVLVHAGEVLGCQLGRDVECQREKT